MKNEKDNLKEMIINNPRAKERIAMKEIEREIKELDRIKDLFLYKGRFK